MDKNIILNVVNRQAQYVWQDLRALYPQLYNFTIPTIVLNNRLWRSAGFCYQQQNRVDLGTKFFLHSDEYRDYMLDVILPHELIHQADFFLHGESDLKCGHGMGWCKIMCNYGLEPEPFHDMEITR